MAGFREIFRADMAAAGCKRLGLLAGIWYFISRYDYSAVLFFRLSQKFYNMNNKPGRLLALVFWRLNTLVNSCDMRPQAIVGPGLNLPHPVGVILGFPVTIGKNCTIHQHVTFGRRSTNDAEADTMCLTVGDNVVIASGAVLISGAEVGDNCEIGANSVVAKPVPANSVAIGVPARVFPRKAAEPDTVVTHNAPAMAPVAIVASAEHLPHGKLASRPAPAADKARAGIAG